METFVIYWSCTEAGSRITCMKTGRKETDMNIHLTEKEAMKLLVLVRHYANTLNSSTMKARQETIDFYEDLYDDLGVQIEQQKRGAENA